MGTAEVLLSILISILLIVFGVFKYRKAKAQAKGTKKWIAIAVFGGMAFIGAFMPQPDYKKIETSQPVQSKVVEEAPQPVNETQAQDNKQSDTQMETLNKNEDWNEAANANPNSIGVVAGLGDSLADFEKGKDVLNRIKTHVSFENGIEVEAKNGIVTRISIPADENGNIRPSVVTMLPSDAKKVGVQARTIDDSKENIAIYHSQKLETAVPYSKGVCTRYDFYSLQTGQYKGSTLLIGKAE